MRILRVDLTRFGRFTDATVDLSAGHYGLHLIAGNNEAGKSTFLRALSAWLFGIPIRSSDDFVHRYDQMRVGGVLQHRDGRSLHCVRRKANKRTLRGGDDESDADEPFFLSILNGLDEASFSSRFGLSYEALVKGGLDIVQGNGELGQVLFASASGLRQLHRIQEDFQSQYRQLYVPRGNKQRLQQLVQQQQALQTTLQKQSLTTEAYQQQRDGFEHAKQSAAQLAVELQQIDRQLDRLQRLDEASQMLGRYRELQEQWLELEPVRSLPNDFAELCQRAITEQSKAKQRLDSISEQLQSVEPTLQGPTEFRRWIDSKDAIGRLIEQGGAAQKARLDAKELRRQRRDQQTLLDQLRQQLGSGINDRWTEPLPLPAQQQLDRLLQSLAKQLGQREQLLEQTRDYQRELTQPDRTPPSPSPLRDPDALRRCLERMESIESRRQVIEQAATQVKRLLQRHRSAVARLHPPLPETTSLASIPIPLAETIAGFASQWDELSQADESCRQSIDAIDQQLASIEQQQSQSGTTGELPTETALLDARLLRDQHAATLASLLASTGQLPSPQGAAQLAQLQQTIAQCDQWVDRLRRESQRVAQQQQWTIDRQRFEQERQHQHTKQQAAETRKETLATEWKGLWRSTGIDPLEPRVMAVWRAQMGPLVESEVAAEEAAEQARGLQIQFDRHMETLRNTLLQAAAMPFKMPADSIEIEQLAKQWLEQHDSVTEAQRRSEALRVRAKQQAEASQLELVALEQSIDETRGKLTEFVRSQGWPEIAVDSIRDILPIARQYHAIRRDADQIDQRLDGIDEECKQFAVDVQTLVTSLGPLLDSSTSIDTDAGPHQTVQYLSKQLSDALLQQKQRDDLCKRRDQIVVQRESATAELQKSDAVLLGLYQRAGVESIEGLFEAASKSDRRRAAWQPWEDIRSQWMRWAGELGIDEFLSQVTQHRHDPLAADATARLREERQSLRERRDRLQQDVGQLQAQLESTGIAGDAAETAQQLEECRTEQQRVARQYLQLRWADEILKMAIERYRQQNEDPLMRHASDLFAQLTDGGFDCIRSDYDADAGRPILVGQRKGGGVVEVSGMSDGTADQLYLALRLASLLTYVDRHGPMPLILDDILIKFDDARSAAALRVLAQCSDQTQIIFLTHHDHLIELAKGVPNASKIHVQRLSTG
jgi:uncharacterized protein YhaN